MSTLTSIIYVRSQDYVVGATPTTGPFAIPFTFGDDDQVVVYVDGVEEPNFTITKASEYSIEGNEVNLDAAVSNVTVTVRSETPPTRTSSAAITAGSVSREVDRMYGLLQETYERLPIKNVSGAYDFLGGRLTNVAAPVDAGDVALKSYVDAFVGGTAAAQAAAEAAQAAAEAAEANAAASETAAGVSETNAAASEAAAAATLAGALQATNNLSDLDNAATSRTNLQAAGAQAAGYTGDIDSLAATGFFRLDTGFTNGWSGAAAGDFVQHMQWDANTAKQLGFDALGVAWYRRKAGGTWSAWAKMAAESYVDRVEVAMAAIPSSGPEYTGLPSGITEIDFHLDLASLSGTNDMIVQLSTGATFVNTGYLSTGMVSSTAAVSHTASAVGMIIPVALASRTVTGVIKLRKAPGSNLWQCELLGRMGTADMVYTRGKVTLAGELDGVRVASLGVNTFDGGEAGLTYKFR